jgi:hypothetical protein
MINNMERFDYEVVNNSQVHITTSRYIPNATVKNKNKGVAEAKALTWEQAESVVKGLAFTNDPKIQYTINFLIDIGWRGSESFNGRNFRFKSILKEYDQDTDDVYGIEIVKTVYK